jgi:hypothetical protein
MSRRPTILGLHEAASALLADLRTSPAPAVGGDTTALLRRVVEHTERVIARAEKDSARAHPDGAHREAEVARALGTDPSTLRRWRGAQRAARAARE